MTVTRSARLAGAALCVAVAAGCAQPTAGRPVADSASAEQATSDAVRRGLDAFQSHFVNLGDEHARVYNYLNFGDVKITTEHESYKVGDPPAVLLKRRFAKDGSWSETLTPPSSETDYVKLDDDHKFLAPTPWVSVPSLWAGTGFDNCFLLTAWVACHLDKAIGQTKLDAPDEQPNEARATEDGFEVTTGALLGVMLDEGFISIPEEKRDGVTDPMKKTVVPVVLKFDKDMGFTGFEIRDTVSDGDAPQLELQLEYEVIGKATKDDVPDAPDAGETTAITDKAAVDQFWEKFNDRTPEN
ncbi:hypothetical protein [Actinophytocola oryzae]|uniref:Lipoprotein n=1 Tax=Actinophytocola oryzae TaxID=502181 RepID=A0A4V3FSF0_9PSEU|nr:hypothetical protein [Actinophytocola oryzae]TDV47171.1 hypothetical protein CLV71_110355 [Actinophytocola oryzae]